MYCIEKKEKEENIWIVVLSCDKGNGDMNIFMCETISTSQLR
jgi:hypothetical protein